MQLPHKAVTLIIIPSQKTETQSQWPQYRMQLRRQAYRMHSLKRYKKKVQGLRCKNNRTKLVLDRRRTTQKNLTRVLVLSNQFSKTTSNK